MFWLLSALEFIEVNDLQKKGLASESRCCLLSRAARNTWVCNWERPTSDFKISLCFPPLLTPKFSSPACNHQDKRTNLILLGEEKQLQRSATIACYPSYTAQLHPAQPLAVLSCCSVGSWEWSYKSLESFFAFRNRSILSFFKQTFPIIASHKPEFCLYSRHGLNMLSKSNKPISVHFTFPFLSAATFCFTKYYSIAELR